MKKSVLLILVLLLITCSTTEVEEGSIEETISDSESTITTQSSNNNDTADSTTTSVVENYNFDSEKMSPFTGIELPPELWLKRPRRVIAFKIDNNINARPQSGIQESDVIFEYTIPFKGDSKNIELWTKS